MKLIDYVFPAAAILLIVYLALKFEELSKMQIIMIILLIVLSGFQFSLRRAMRRRSEKDKNS